MELQINLLVPVSFRCLSLFCNPGILHSWYTDGLRVLNSDMGGTNGA